MNEEDEMIGDEKFLRHRSATSEATSMGHATKKKIRNSKFQIPSSSSSSSSSRVVCTSLSRRRRDDNLGPHDASRDVLAANSGKKCVSKRSLTSLSRYLAQLLLARYQSHPLLDK